MKNYFLLALFLLSVHCQFPNHAQAQVGATTKVDAQSISVGDQLRYFVTLSVDTQKSRIYWAQIPDTFNKLELVERGKIDTSYQGSLASYKQRLLITGFDSGSFLIPQFVFLAKNGSGSLDTVLTDSFRIAVSTIPVDTNLAFKDIKTIATISTTWLDYLPIIIGTLIGLGILIWVILYFIKNRKQAKKFQEPVVVETFHQKAVRLLQELDDKQLWQQEQSKAYYTELSDIIRQYIEARFNTNAMELTTDELLRMAKKHREMAQFRKSLKPLLQAADLAKFAKAHPLPEEHIEALELAKTFVKVSKPIVPQSTTTQNSVK